MTGSTLTVEELDSEAEVDDEGSYAAIEELDSEAEVEEV